MRSTTLNLITLIALGTNLTYAQKLPTVQQASIRAPAIVKIDGKASEWSGQLQAYNKTTGIFYTIANDDENLYLIVQATDPRIIQKILWGGITFTANTTGKESYKEKENLSVFLPVISFSYVRYIIKNAGDKAHYSGLSPGGQPVMNLGGADVLTRTDSTVQLANKRLAEQAKTIKIHGINAIPDTAISVYNEYGIKAAVAFNNNGNYIYELAIPLKYFGKPVNDLQKLTYSIRLNGFDTGGGYVDKVSKQRILSDPDIATETKFWGEYTLAKK